MPNLVSRSARCATWYTEMFTNLLLQNYKQITRKEAQDSNSDQKK